MTAFYRGRQVFQHTALCPRGLRLVGPDGGDPALQGLPFILPDPSESLVDQAVKNYVTRVLQSLGGGLSLWRDKQWLYVQRLGHCHTYWALGEEHLPPTCRPEGEVPKEHGTCVFDLRQFVEGESARPGLWDPWGSGNIAQVQSSVQVALFSFCPWFCFTASQAHAGGTLLSE